MEDGNVKWSSIAQKMKFFWLILNMKIGFEEYGYLLLHSFLYSIIKRRRFLIDIWSGDVISLPKSCMLYDCPLFRPPNPLLHLPTSCDNRIIKFFKDAFRILTKICSRHIPIFKLLFVCAIALCKILARVHTWFKIKDIANFAKVIVENKKYSANHENIFMKIFN